MLGNIRSGHQQTSDEKKNLNKNILEEREKYSKLNPIEEI